MIKAYLLFGKVRMDDVVGYSRDDKIVLQACGTAAYYLPKVVGYDGAYKDGAAYAETEKAALEVLAGALLDSVLDAKDSVARCEERLNLVLAELGKAENMAG